MAKAKRYKPEQIVVKLREHEKLQARHLDAEGAQLGKMVSPARRRDAVSHLCRRFPVSERRACRVVGQNRSTQRYRPSSPEFEQQLIARMNELCARHPRYGYRRIWALLRGEGFEVNRKRIERLWRLEGLRVPPQRSSRQKEEPREQPELPAKPGRLPPKPDLEL